MNLKFSSIVLVAFFIYSCSDNNKPNDINIQINNKKIKKDMVNIVSIEMKNRSDLLGNKIWRKFDSVLYKWENDTLHLNHIRFVKNICGDYELSYNLLKDTLSLSFIDKTQCELATIIETNSKIRIEKN